MRARLGGMAVLLMLASTASTDATRARPPALVTVQEDVLRSSRDPAALERAAAALARSGDEASLRRLQQLLTDAAFLARLDNVAASENRHVAVVIAALAGRPSPRAVALCEMLAEDPVFVSASDRKSLVLDALASMAPMTERTAAVFQRANGEGYFSYNALLLAGNGSASALRLFESMMADTTEPPEVRVEAMHKGFVPRRQQPPILRLAGRILAATKEPAIAVGVVESIFDYRPEWFGIESRMPPPPAWSAASAEARQAALAVADRALQQREITGALRALVARQRSTLVQGKSPGTG